MLVLSTGRLCSLSYRFHRENNVKKTFNLIQKEVKEIGDIKASFGLEIKFVREAEKENGDPKKIQKFSQNLTLKKNSKKISKNFVDVINGQIENWSEKGSGWAVDEITIAYVNNAKYQPLKGGSFIPLPPKLADKRAIINVQNKRDNQRLKWSLRSALFPVEVHPERLKRYKDIVDDGIDWTGIDFPTPLKQIDKLEKQNGHLAINVFGWQNDEVCFHRMSKNDKEIKRINLMLLEGKEKTHSCWIKRFSALLYDQTKLDKKKFFCMMCLTCFTTEKRFESYAKYCKGVNGVPTRIEMPKEGQHILKFENFKTK